MGRGLRKESLPVVPFDRTDNGCQKACQGFLSRFFGNRPETVPVMKNASREKCRDSGAGTDTALPEHCPPERVAFEKSTLFLLGMLVLFFLK